jgi:hypothetical protein
MGEDPGAAAPQNSNLFLTLNAYGTLEILYANQGLAGGAFAPVQTPH